MPASSPSDPAAVTLKFGRCRRLDEAGPATPAWMAEWVLKRNCSLRPGQLGVFYLSLCVVSLGIAGFFWSRGVRLVMPFAWIELLAVGAALLVYARHAADRERVELTPDRLTVERWHGGREERTVFATDRVRVSGAGPGEPLIVLSAQGRQVNVGRFVRPELRKQLAEEFKSTLRWGASRPGAGAG